MPKAIISNATIPRLAVGTANTATPTDVVSDNSQPAILLDITQLAALGLTNQVAQFRVIKFYDADNSCAHMQMAVLCTAPEAAA